MLKSQVSTLVVEKNNLESSENEARNAFEFLESNSKNLFKEVEEKKNVFKSLLFIVLGNLFITIRNINIKRRE